MGVEKIVRVEGDELTNQAAKRGVGRCVDRGIDPAEKVREIMSAQCQSRHNTEAATAAALEAPEQVGVGAGVSDPHRAVCGDDLSFEKISGRGPDLFGMPCD